MKKKIIITIIIVLIIGLIVGLIAYKLSPNSYSVNGMYLTNERGEKIFVNLYKPNKKGKYPIVIYSHGLGASYRACGDYADHLAKEGVASVCIDFRGGSNRSKSDGLTTEMSFLTEMEDVEFLIKEVKTWDFVDTDNIILMGSSQGGAVSALVSSSHPDDIKGAILLYPALSIPEAVRNWYNSTDEIPDEVPMTTSITVGPKYFKDIWDMNVYDQIVKDEKKILIIHGTEDPLVNISLSRKINELYKNSELFEIEGAGHGFDDEYFDEAIVHVDDYLKDINVIK